MELDYNNVKSLLIDEKRLTEHLFRRREDIVTHGPFDQELAVLNCVRNGDVELLSAMLDEARGFSVGIMSADIRRQSMYLVVAATALASRFAIEGGLDTETAYTLSDLYIQSADVCSVGEQLSAYTYAMLLDFTQRVAVVKKRPSHSIYVQKCIEYITTHLHYKISLQALADHCGRSCAFISGTFKKETGTTVSAFILQSRLEEAQRLLRYSSLKSQQISDRLGFSTPSFFASVFKQAYGETPVQYRKKHCRKRLL